MNEMEYIEQHACPTLINHETSVCKPISIAPFADVGTVVVECGGAPVVREGYSSCSGSPNECCAFTVSQTMMISIPIEFGASVHAGQTYVNCGATNSGLEQECPCTGTCMENLEE